MSLFIKSRILFLLGLAVSSFYVGALTVASGNITALRSPSYENETVYFQITPTPEGVSQWLYLRSDTETQAGCRVNGDTNTINRTYSMLLAAKTANAEITVSYCVDTNGYGLINYVELR